VNTVLFAGFDGYLVKLWMVNPTTADYAGLYSWSSIEDAERYGRYITAILRPFSRRGSVAYQVLPEWTLEDYLGRSGDPSALNDDKGSASGGSGLPTDVGEAGGL